MTDTDAALERDMERRRRRRQAAETRFIWYGRIALGTACAVLLAMLGSILFNGIPAFWQHEVALDVDLEPQALGIPAGALRDDLLRGDYAEPLRRALAKEFPQVESRLEKRALYRLLSSGAAFQLQDLVVENPERLGARERMTFPLSDEADMLLKGALSRALTEAERPISDGQIAWLDELVRRGRIERSFDFGFFTRGDSREPELAGVGSAIVGSLITLAITLGLCLPLGIATAVYLEQFAPRNRWTDLIEVNINNLAAVPSIVFGLLGLAVFLNLFGVPRSAPLAGGLVLSLLILPTIIIASRAALQAVPPSVLEAALAVGASRMQAVGQHVLPLAMPGIMTGTIIGMAHALGETAPLLMIGMVAFIADVPASLSDPATVLPVQVFLWADSPERAFVGKTSAAILVLLSFLILMNLLAVVLRRRFEHRW
jgi:phosphate transport system permease protein